MTEALTLQGILQRHLSNYAQHHGLDARSRAVCQHLMDCHTQAMGGLQLHCDHCQQEATYYYGCRDRHCPGCQHQAAERWRDQQQQQLLPVTYFHLVFTLPSALNGWVALHPKMLYSLLFRSVWATLSAFARSPRRLGGKLGMTALLHTWGQTLVRHPHVHCLVPGGALDETGHWRPAKGHYLFPVRALSRRFRGHMVSALRQAWQAGELLRVNHPGEPEQTLNRLMQHPWVVYCRAGMQQPEEVVGYLARYTHRSAISNQRLVAMDADQVMFRYKDYSDHNRVKRLSLSVDEFIRRFTQHILPKGLMRIRHYGFLANACRREKLARVRQAIDEQAGSEAKSAEEEVQALQGREALNGWRCPNCRQGMLRVVGECPPRRWEGGG